MSVELTEMEKKDIHIDFLKCELMRTEKELFDVYNQLKNLTKQVTAYFKEIEDQK